MMKHNLKRLLSLIVLCAMLLTAIPVGQASSVWSYQALDGGFAILTGYNGDDCDQLQLPAEVDGLGVIGIRDGVLSQIAGLQTVVVPGRYTELTAEAFPANVTVRALRGTAAWQLMRQANRAVVDLSTMDLYPDVVDLSDVPDMDWTDNGALSLPAADGRRLDVGSKLWIPDGLVDRGLHMLRVTAVSYVSGRCVVSVSDDVAVFDYLKSLKITNEKLYADFKQVQPLSNDVRILPSTSSISLSGTLPTNEVHLGLELDGFKVDCSLTRGITATLNAEYDFMRKISSGEDVIRSLDLRIDAEDAIKLTVSGEKSTEESGKSYEKKLFSVPMVSASGAVTLYMKVSAVFSISGEISVSVTTDSSINVTKNSAGWSVTGQIDNRSTNVYAEATATAGIKVSFDLKVLMGKVRVLSLSFDPHLEIKASATNRDADDVVCTDLSFAFVTDWQLEAGLLGDTPVSKESDEKQLLYYSVSGTLYRKDFAHQHYENAKLVDHCRYDGCRVIFHPGTLAAIPMQTVKIGGLVQEPMEPLRPGFSFNGWYSNQSLSKRWRFDTDVVKHDMELFAAWRNDDTGNIEAGPVYPEDYEMIFGGSGGTGGSSGKAVAEFGPINPCGEACFKGMLVCSVIGQKSGGGSLVLPSQVVGEYQKEKRSAIVWRIADRAFSGNLSLVSVTMPSTMRYVRDDAFYHCMSLRNVHLNKGLIYLGNYAFSSCHSLKQISIPSGEIGQHAFENCSSLETVTMGAGITGICTGAFKDCISLKSVNIPSLPSLPNELFSNCKSLVSVDIAEGPKTIGMLSFADCDSLKSFRVPNSTSFLGVNAFEGCNSLESVSLGSGIMTVAYRTFADCPSLRSISFPDQIQTIENETFSNCTGLRTATMGSGMREIYYDAFRGCTALEDLSLNEGLVTIGNDSFNGCTSLKAVDLPDSLTSLGFNTFSNCSSLRSVHVGGGMRTLGIDSEDQFNGCTQLKDLTFAEGLQELGRAFINCTQLETVTLPNSLTKLSNNAFFGDSALREVKLGSGLKALDLNAFVGCSSLTRLNVPDSVTGIGNSMPRECVSLRELTVGSGVHTIEPNQFASLQSLASITLSSGVTSVQGNAFFGLPSLESVRIEGMNTTFALGSFDPAGIASDTLTVMCYRGSTAAKYFGRIRDEKWNPDLTILIRYIGEDCCVKFETNGAEAIPAQSVPFGKKLTRPADPVKADSLFLGWYSDEECTQAWNFEVYAVKQMDMTLYARWCDAELIYSTDADGALSGYLGNSPEATLPLQYEGKPLTAVGAMAFGEKVCTVNMHAGIRDVDKRAFLSATRLRQINVASDNPSLLSVDGVLYSADGKTLLCYPAGRQETSYTVLAGTQNIGPYAFANATALTDLYLPPEIVSIDATAFFEVNDALILRTSVENAVVRAAAERDMLLYNCCRIRLHIAQSASSSTIRTFTGYAPVGGTLASGANELLCMALSLLGWDEDGNVVCGWSLSAGGAQIDPAQVVIPTNELELYALWSGEFVWSNVSAGKELTAYHGLLRKVEIPNAVDGSLVVSIAENAFAGLGDAYVLVGVPGSAAERFADQHRIDFEPVERTLRCVDPSGSYAARSYSVVPGELLSFLPTPQGEGLIFKGWVDGDDNPWNPATDRMPDGELILNATWTENEEADATLGLRYTLDGGEAIVTGYDDRALNLDMPATLGGCPVTAIGGEAFSDCRQLYQVTLPATVKRIGERAFATSSVCVVELPAGLTALGKQAFMDCKRLVDITLPAGSYEIAEDAFAGCNALRTATLCDGVTAIRSGAFNGCSMLSTLTLPSTLAAIDSRAFAFCTALETVAIPASVMTIAADAFAGCSSLETWQVASGNAAFSAADASLMNKAGDRLLQYAASGSSAVPNGVLTIGENAFADAKCASVSLPASITSIEDGAFRGCIYLQSLALLADTRLQFVGASAFAGCHSLTEISLPDSVVAVGADAFEDCRALRTIRIASAETSMDEDALAALTDVTLYAPKASPILARAKALGLRCIDETTVCVVDVALDTSALTVAKNASVTPPVRFTPDNTTERQYTIETDDPLIAVGDRNGALIGRSQGATGFTIIAANGARVRGQLTVTAERKPTALTITLPISALSIGASAYPSVTVQPSQALLGAVQLSSSAPEIVSVRSDQALVARRTGSAVITAQYAGLKATMTVQVINDWLNLPTGLDTLGAKSFMDCVGLVKVRVADGTRVIGAMCFARCTALRQIVIPASVEQIADDAFSGCSSDLTILCAPGSVAEQYARNHGLDVSNDLSSN